METTFAAVEALAAALNPILHDAHAREVEHHIKHERPFEWEFGLSADAVRTQLMSVNHRAVTAKDRSKYIALDVSGSGKFLVEKSTGDIFGIKGYGVIHRGHRYGNMAAPDLKTLADKCFGDWHSEFVEVV